MFPHPVYFYFRQHFHIEYLKMAARAVLHFSIALQMTNIVPGTKIVCRTAKKSCGECSPEVPGVPRQFRRFKFLTLAHFLCCRYRQYFPPQIKCISFAVIKRINQDIQYIKDINIYFFVRKRYILLLFSTKKVHNVTFQYIIDTIHYFFVSKRHKSLLSQEEI